MYRVYNFLVQIYSVFTPNLLSGIVPTARANISPFTFKPQTLISLSLCEAMAEAVNEFVVFQAPARNGEKG